MDGEVAPGVWAYTAKSGELVGGLPRSKGYTAHFKHLKDHQGGSVFEYRVEGVRTGRSSLIGFAAEDFDVDRAEETGNSTAVVSLYNGTAIIRPDMSLDGKKHLHSDYLQRFIPKSRPYNVAVRCQAVSNVPQIQFNNDGVWHDFAPGRVALKYSAKANSPNGMLPYLRVDEPKGVTPSEAI
jgi:hypothetical protein